MYGTVCLKQSVTGPKHLGFWPGIDEDPGAVVSQDGRHWVQAREAALVCNSENKIKSWGWGSEERAAKQICQA